MENSLIIGRNSEAKAKVTKQLLKGFINKDINLVVYTEDIYTNYFEDLENYTNVNYIDDVELLKYVIDDIIDTDKKTVIFLYDYAEELNRIENEDITNKIIDLIKHSENIKFVISCKFIGFNGVRFDKITEKTKDIIRNRIVFQINGMLGRRSFDVDIDRWLKIGDLRDNGEFIAYQHKPKKRVENEIK